MNGKLRALIFCMLPLWVVLPLRGIDFGLDVTNDSEYSIAGTDGWNYYQGNQASAWLAIPLSPSADLYVSGLYAFSGDFAEGSYDIMPWRLDVGRTELSGTVAGKPGSNALYRYNLGRILLNDQASQIHSGLIDGARLEAGIGNLTLFAGGGYRGFLYKKDAMSIIDGDDIAAYADDGVYFGPKRAVLALGIKAIEFWKDLDAGLEAFGQFDLEEEGTTTNTQYLEPYLDGRLGRNLRFRIWQISEFGQNPEVFTAIALGGSLKASYPEFSHTHIGLSGAWAGGEEGSFKAYTAIKQKQVGSVAPLFFSNMTFLALDVSVTPHQGFSPSLTCTAQFMGGEFSGAEISGGLFIQPFSDLSFSVNGGCYVPDGLGSGSEDMRFKAVFSATLQL